MNRPAMIILTGPTAVGKTELSIRLAKEIGGEIISADSMQVYRGMDIGTAKITPEEMQGVKHHLIDCFEPDEEFNVAVFQELARKAAKEMVRLGFDSELCGLARVVKKDIDAVIHFAGLKAVGESVKEPLWYYSNNITGTLKLLGVMKKHGCNKIVFSSSATVYGENNVAPYVEEMPTSATNPYGWTKVMQEKIKSERLFTIVSGSPPPVA